MHVRGRLPTQNGLSELQDKTVPSQPSIARALPGLHSKGRSNGNYDGENGGVKLELELILSQMAQKPMLRGEVG